MRILKSYLIVILLFLNFIGLAGQTVIRDLSIESKKNGAYLRFSTSGTIQIRNTSGWIRKGNYFYLTVMNAQADSTQIMTTGMMSPVKKLELTHVGESTQFAFELDQVVESFDLYQSDNPPELLVSLRFPITEVIATLQNEKEQSRPVISQTGPRLASVGGSNYGKIRNALYLTGASLTVAGIISQDNQSGTSWEFPIGMGILVGTYVYDKYIKPLL